MEESLNDQIRGLKQAVWIAEKCEMHDTGLLSPKHAAEAMKEIIVGCLRAHAQAAEATDIDIGVAEHVAEMETDIG